MPTVEYHSLMVLKDMERNGELNMQDTMIISLKVLEASLDGISLKMNGIRLHSRKVLLESQRLSESMAHEISDL